MISETVVLWLGTVALLTTYAGVAKADNPASSSVAYIFGFLFWAAFTMNALNYQVFSGGTGTETSAQSLAVIGLIAALTTIILLFDSAFTVIKKAL